MLNTRVNVGGIQTVTLEIELILEYLGNLDVQIRRIRNPLFLYTPKVRSFLNVNFSGSSQLKIF